MKPGLQAAQRVSVSLWVQKPLMNAKGHPGRVQNCDGRRKKNTQLSPNMVPCRNARLSCPLHLASTVDGNNNLVQFGGGGSRLGKVIPQFSFLKIQNLHIFFFPSVPLMLI